MTSQLGILCQWHDICTIYTIYIYFQMFLYSQPGEKKVLVLWTQQEGDDKLLPALNAA